MNEETVDLMVKELVLDSMNTAYVNRLKHWEEKKSIKNQMEILDLDFDNYSDYLNYINEFCKKELEETEKNYNETLK
ncbi:MAG: hypothetical protein GY777_13815 [Candidatus Brocadiaceae bacterium]|nr:hypothetical protein [Candidatus Brocadiaceae bacterium]